MLLDIIAVLLLILAVYKGFRKGLIIAVFSFIAFIVGLAAALKLSSVAAGYIGEAVSLAQRWLPVVAFFLVFFIVVLLIKLGAVVIEKLVKVAMLGWVNRIGGIVFFILIYFFIYSIILFYASQLGLIRPSATTQSTAYRIIGPMAPSIVEGLGYIFPFFRDMFEQLLNFFQNVSDTHSLQPPLPQ
ncbi:MAG: CvpA family protein [Flavisolibacter sp.]|jgi:membrane protein required for colicin V production|nr:CvpA family protein [Flavisolibacter sp.]